MERFLSHGVHVETSLRPGPVVPLKRAEPRGFCRGHPLAGPPERGTLVFCRVSEQLLAALLYFSVSFGNVFLCRLGRGLSICGEAAPWAALSGGDARGVPPGARVPPADGAPRGSLSRRSCQPALGFRPRAAAGCLLRLPLFARDALASRPSAQDRGGGCGLRR